MNIKNNDGEPYDKENNNFARYVKTQSHHAVKSFAVIYALTSIIECSIQQREISFGDALDVNNQNNSAVLTALRIVTHKAIKPDSLEDNLDIADEQECTTLK